jgi:dCTP diphosphatase
MGSHVRGLKAPQSKHYGYIPMDRIPDRPLVDVTGLCERLSRISAERAWEPFHTPKNLSMALAGEVGELLAEMQWLKDDEILQPSDPSDLRRRIRAELADVLVYLVRLSQVLGIDLDESVNDKLNSVEERYRPDDIRGSADKR